MINKQSLWFLTLFSLILVLSVYYITMPNELLLTNNSYVNTETTSSTAEDNDKTNVTIKENELLVTMRVNLEDERSSKITELRSTLTNEEATSEEKNNAYEQIKFITNLNVQESSLEEKIKKEFKLDSFVKIDDNQIQVVAIKKDHDVTLANKIMKTVQKEFKNKMSITVKFEN